MALPVGVYRQRGPRCFLDALLATISLGPPLAHEGTATKTTYGAVIYMSKQETTRLLLRKIHHRMIIATDSYSPLTTVMHVIIFCRQGKKMCATLCGD